MSVLIVEDNKFDQEFIKRAMETVGVETDLFFAKDGLNALDILRDGLRPDVILLDVNMPGMDGKALLKTLKTDNRWRRIPAVMFSTVNSEEEISACYDLYANAYMVKPDTVEGYRKLARHFADFWLQENRALK